MNTQYTCQRRGASGAVSGNVSCHDFRTKAGGQSLNNYLFNVRIVATDLSPHYLSPVYKTQTASQVVKWLE